MVKQWVFCWVIMCIALQEIISVESSTLEVFGAIVISLVVASAIYLFMLWIFEGEIKL